MLQVEEYVVSFLNSYRSEANKLQDSEKAVFGEYAEEYVLTKPLQVEVIELSGPYRLIWIFLLDKTKPDLRISIHNEDWKNIDNIIEKLRTKYSKLKLNRSEMHRMLRGFRDMNSKCIYSLDAVKGALGICFSFNIGLTEGPFARWLGTEANPQEVAKIVYGLNRSQAADEYFEPEILAQAVRQLKKKGYTPIEAL